jgi:choline dehydrogenase-like flavoprotein
LIKRQLATDVCIIGCGPAGITIAKELVKSGIRTLISESGGMSADSFAQGLLQGSASGPIIKGYPNYIGISRVAGVLGSASRWGGYCTPLAPIDFQQRDWIPDSGWPFSAGTVAPYASRAASSLGISSFGSAHEMLPESSSDATGRLTSHPYHYPQKLHRLRDHLLTLAGHPCFQLELGATAVDFGVSNDQVRWLRALSADGQECYVEARTFVLAAGGIENARILLVNSAAIPANEEVLGRYFQEHFHVLAGKARIPNARAWREYLRIAHPVAWSQNAADHGTARRSPAHPAVAKC